MISMFLNRVQSSHVDRPTHRTRRSGSGSLHRCTSRGRVPAPPMPTEIKPSSVQLIQYLANAVTAPGFMNSPRATCATRPLRSMHSLELRCEPMMMT